MLAILNRLVAVLVVSMLLIGVPAPAIGAVAPEAAADWPADDAGRSSRREAKPALVTLLTLPILSCGMWCTLSLPGTLGSGSALCV